ncbi:MAG: L,D-transpeptidase [Lachnospiraceae bacterium]|nr:L,D-transpeptidase [Lachnospiraceae bacterium]
MLKKRILAISIVCCVLLSGCSLQKTDTSGLRAFGIDSARSENTAKTFVAGGDIVRTECSSEAFIVGNDIESALLAAAEIREASLSNALILNDSDTDTTYAGKEITTPEEKSPTDLTEASEETENSLSAETISLFAKETPDSENYAVTADTEAHVTELMPENKKETVVYTENRVIEEKAPTPVKNEKKETKDDKKTEEPVYYKDLDSYVASLGLSKAEIKMKTDEFLAEEDTLLEKLRTAVRDWDDLAPTSHMSFDELIGDNGIYEYPKAFPLPDTYKIIVDLKYQVVLVYAKDGNGDYTVPVRYMLCSTGADKTQSPVGTFEMKNYRVRFSQFVNTESFGQYWSLITGRIYFHSVLYSSKNASDYVSSTWNNLGKNVSHGCIRLTVPDARFIYYNMAPGTVVQIRKGSDSDKATKEIRDRLIEEKAKVPSQRLKLKPGEIPYTDNWKKEEVSQIIPFVQGHQ